MRAAALLIFLGCGAKETPPVQPTPSDRPNAVASASIHVPEPEPVVEDSGVAIVVDAGIEAGADAAAGDDLRAKLARLSFETHPSPPRPPRPAPVMPIKPMVYETLFRTSAGLPFAWEVAHRVLRGRLNTASQCYNQELARNPTIEGRVVVRMAIDKRGRVILAEPIASTVSEQLRGCIVRIMHLAEFPTFEGQEIAGVEYGLTFEN